MSFVSDRGLRVSIQVEPQAQSRFDELHSESTRQFHAVGDIENVSGPIVLEALEQRCGRIGRQALDRKPAEACELESMLASGGEGFSFHCVNYPKGYKIYSTVYWVAGHIIRVVSD